MKLNRETLMNKLSKASSIANYKEAKGLIKLTIEKMEAEKMYELSFYGADGINTALTTLQVESDNANIGSYFIDAKKLIGYLNNLGAFGSEELTLAITDVLEIQTEKSTFKFPLENPKSYPDMPQMQFKEGEAIYCINVDSKLLVNRLGILAKTVVTDGSRPILNYANFRVSAKEMVMLSTDATRVTKTVIDCTAMHMHDSKEIEEELVVNVNPIILSRLLTYEDGKDISLIVTKDNVFALDTEGMITMKSMNEEYPDFSNFLLPVDFSKKVPFASVFTTDCNDLNAALKLMKSGIVNEKDKLVQFNLASDKQTVSTSKTNGVVDAKDKTTKTGKDSGEITLSGDLSGEELVIKFDNNKLNVLMNGPKTLRICFTSSVEPVFIFNAEEENNHKYTIMIMPVK